MENTRKSRLQKWGEKYPRLSDGIVGFLFIVLLVAMTLYMVRHWEP